MNLLKMNSVWINVKNVCLPKTNFETKLKKKTVF